MIFNKNELKGLSPNNKSIKLYKKSLHRLSKIQMESSVGLILGDGSMQTQNNGKT